MFDCKEEIKDLQHELRKIERRVKDLEEFDESQRKVKSWIMQHWWQTLLVTVTGLAVVAEIVAKIKGFI